MTTTTPAFAIVRPRVLVKRTGESRLLDEVVAEITDEYGSGFVRLTGGPGSGKSTALAHLAAVFSHNEHVQFLDEPTAAQLETCSSDVIVIAAMPTGDGRNMELALQPWGMDELIEYLLVEHHDACGSVIERMGAAGRYRWLPLIATIVLERFAVDASLSNPVDALIQHIEEQIPKPKQRQAAAQFSLAMLTGGSKQVESAVSKLASADLPHAMRKLLLHDIVQLPLAAERLKTMISNGDFGDLERTLPWKLVKLVGRRCADAPQTINQIIRLLGSRRAESAHAMAASILLAADPDWQPKPRDRPWKLNGAIFKHARWPGVNFCKAMLDHCDLSDAELKGANFTDSLLDDGHFDGANLAGAQLLRVRAQRSYFRRANLMRANLTHATLRMTDLSAADLAESELASANLTESILSSAVLIKANLRFAKLVGATLEDANLTNAILRRADLTGVDLRRVAMNGACFEEAVMNDVQLEDVLIVGAQLRNARLDGAHLTGSSLPEADLRGANLTGAGLAEIDWEGVDLRGAVLRGATFHMGSSRSGLVGSPYACEGSKTGFYTDDYEDMNFKRPEEVRKANLCAADLRGVAAQNVDFYLVDLRGAKLDPELLEQARNTGAILEDFVEQ